MVKLPTLSGKFYFIYYFLVGTSFCSKCRRIPAFSEKHVSTGSTVGSLSYQDDLELRFLDDEIDLMEPCSEHEEENEDGDASASTVVNKELDDEREIGVQNIEQAQKN